MSSIAVIPTVVNDIVDNADERELWIVGREFERPPYFHAGKGGDTRLARALRVCLDGRITPNSDGSYTVEGSEHRTYRVTEICSCPQSQKAQSKWCYHAVAVALYVEWQRRIRNAAPVALGTLRAGTLPLPPVTAEERLAQATTMDLSTAYVTREPEGSKGGRNEGEQGGDPEPSLTPSLPHSLTPSSPSHMPQEDRMSDDEDFPEPEDLDHADFPAMGQTATAVLEEPMPMLAPVKIPREFTVNIKGKTHVLYTGLVVAARANGLMTLSADWTYNDAELSLAHAVCTFADGRRYEESGDASPSNVSKGIGLHFRRVALTRAKARCLRDALGISECSVEEMEEEGSKGGEGSKERGEKGDSLSSPHSLTPSLPSQREVPTMTPPTDQELRARIWSRVKELAPQARTREAVEAWVKARTRLALHPDNYQAIVEQLMGAA